MQPMAVRARKSLEEGPILDPRFIEHYWQVARRPSWLAAWWVAAKMRKLGVPRAGRVLDVGCGPGWLPRRLAARFRALQIVAVDLSEPMVARARRGPAMGADARIPRFLVADACRLPFASGQFDLVISGATLHHLPSPTGYFSEIDRVMAEDGHVIISDLNRAVPRLLWPLVRLADGFEHRLRPAEARDLPEGIAASYEAAYTADEIERYLDESPLGRRVRVYRRPFAYWIQTPARPAGAAPAGGRTPEREGRSL
jgi:SAM-dependent methyltransferase